MISRADWPAIFAGLFVFFGVEATFGLLAVAIFGFGDAPYLGAGLGIWMLILTIIALAAGGHTTERLADSNSAEVSAQHALTMFGLCVFTVGLAAVLVEWAQPVAGYSFIAVVKHNALWLFFDLLLGGAAAVGAANQSRREQRLSDRTAFRPAA